MVDQVNSPGWATYLRVSDEDKQSPERSFAMQRQRIQEQLLTSSDTPFFREYNDLLSGTKPNRKDYQQMIQDAEAGNFSHLGLYRADRFGRNTVEGLQAATRLISLGIKIRIANMPSLQPESPDGFFMFLIQMGMAQREVDVLAMRTADGMEAKLRQGGWPNKAPEGYANRERPLGSNKYERWVEADPQYHQPLKEAWEMLLTGRYTLVEICEELNRRGYTRSSGRPWAWNDAKSGRRIRASNRLHEIFHHPFYAGWVVSDRFGIKMGEIKGKWEPVVSTDQFERGKEILKVHDNNKSRHKRFHYLLRNMLWVEVGNRKYKMYGSTPTGRSMSYSYYITHAKPGGNAVRFRTDTIDDQIDQWIASVWVDPELVPSIREAYLTEVKQVTQDDQAVSITKLKQKLRKLQEEEARLGRLVITGKISEVAYSQLHDEWNEKVVNIQRKIDEMKFDTSQYFDDLDVALTLLTNISVLYGRLDIVQRTNLLSIFVKRIIINTEGEIIGHELLSPFKYLSSLASRLFGENEEGYGSEHVRYGSSEKPITDVDRFLSLIRFDAREKPQELMQKEGN